MTGKRHAALTISYRSIRRLLLTYTLLVGISPQFARVSAFSATKTKTDTSCVDLRFRRTLIRTITDFSPFPSTTMSDAANQQHTSEDGEPNLLHRHAVRSRSSQSSSNANNIQSSVDDGGGELSSMDISTNNPNPPSAAVAMSAEQSGGGEKDMSNKNDAHLETIDEQKLASSMENDQINLQRMHQPQPRLVRDASVSTEVVTDAADGAGGSDMKANSADFSSTMPMTAFGERQVSSRTLARRAAEQIGTSNHNSNVGAASHSSAAPAASASIPSVTIHLSSEEEHLFQTLLEAADMYERGELKIEDAADKASFRPLGHGDRADSDMAGVGTSTGSSHHSSDSNHSSSNNGNGGQVEIRVAGGWVRDKILNLNSHDVDVALNNMSGVQFATIVQAYLTHLERTGQIPAPQKKHKIGVISANPSQSKHLETATMKIHGIEVDFVNLRAEEVYESHSRIPTHQTKQFGTPLEDVLRRDFTCNSLFYNVRTRQVEDWTGRGIDDLLVRREIVTPLDPHTTFHDDPLRVLRAIRFSVRYDMDLSADIQSAAKSPEVHHSLHLKVSRERVGKELEGMLTGKGARPGRALDLITQLKLAGSVFTFPPGADASVSGMLVGTEYSGSPDELAHHREHGWEEAAQTIRILPRVLESHNDELQMEKEAEEDLTCDSTAETDPAGNVTADVARNGIERMRTSSTVVSSSGAPLLHYHRQKSFSMASSVDMRLVHLSTFLLPFRDLEFLDKKKRRVTVVNHMIKEGIKFKNKDCLGLDCMMSNLDAMRSILIKIRQERIRARQHGQEEEEYPHLPKICRLETGLFLREVRDLWVTCLLQATVAEMRTIELSDSKACPAGPTANDALQTARDFYRAVRAEGLDGCWKARPLINGAEIMTQLGVPKGPEVSTYIQEQIQWMLLNPNGSKEECEIHLRNVKRKREVEAGQTLDEQNEMNLGVSDGGQSSPVAPGSESKHLSKRRHVESMDLSECAAMPKI